MDRECQAIREECLRVSWSMRGGVTYDVALGLSQKEREIIGKIVKDNHEVVKKTGLPYF